MHTFMATHPPAFHGPAPLGETDTRFLLQAIAWACIARARGNHPFGAVITEADGTLLAETHCTTTESGGPTGHAEMNALRQFSRKVSPETHAHATLYISAEPCVMCSTAIFWRDLGREVYGIDTPWLRSFYSPASFDVT